MLSSFDPVFRNDLQLAPKMEYRYSSLKLFQQCPKQFQWKFIDDLPEVSRGIEAFTGSMFHEAAEILHNELMAGNLIALNDFIATFDALWADQYEHGFVREIMGRPISYYQALGHSSCENYYLTNYPFTHEKDLGCEMELQIEIGGYLLNMHIDRVAESDIPIITDGIATDATGKILYIHDYKTSSVKPTKADLAQSMQLAIYEMGVRQHFNYDGDVRLIWHYVRYDKRYESVRTADALEKTKQKIVGIINEIEEAIEFEHFPYRPNFKCDWCPYVDQCEAYAEMKEAKQ